VRVPEDEPLDSLVQARRRVAGEVLGAAARHSAIVDELTDLEELREQRPWKREETARYLALREERLAARRQHDAAVHRLRRLRQSGRPLLV
jgi:hypothetical protein